MKMIVVVTTELSGTAWHVKSCELYLPHQYDQIDRKHAAFPHSLFYMNIDDEELLPYALSIVGSRGGEVVERAGS
jgi:hypothetical protein